ncbi:MAG TPA: hypothetical protein VFU31_09780 [Candidatus Binatia bacterium]|nr:hypothetical protein [Candidatus Binatia bacterium]
MAGTSAYRDIPSDGLETPYGRLYRPQSQGKQILVLIVAFIASMSLGGWVAAIPGGLSTAAQVAFHIPFVLVFCVGYGVWVARINAIVFNGIGHAFLKAFWQLIVHGKQPDSIKDVLPSKDKLLEMLVKGQKAGASFRGVSWPIAALGALFALLCESSMPHVQLVALIVVSVIAWGYFLGFLGRRGWLPFPESD